MDSLENHINGKFMENKIHGGDTVKLCHSGRGADHSAKIQHPDPLLCHSKDGEGPQCPVGGIVPGDNGTISGRCLESLSNERSHTAGTSQPKPSSEAASIKENRWLVSAGLC